MQKLIYYILSITSLLIIGCSDEVHVLPVVSQPTIKLMQYDFEALIIDEDNLASEQTIKNITILLTEPSSNEITHKFINVGFAAVDDYYLITLPVESSELNTKDIYAIANGDDTSFSAITTIAELEKITTPSVDKNNNLDPLNGLCMYGKELNVDFNNNQSIIVYVERTCAKYRITVTFPQDSSLSTDNHFLIGGAANYTYIVANTGNSIPSNAYFNFAATAPLNPDGNGAYTGIAYVYEATQAPKMYIYTHIQGSLSEQEFSAALPVPQRNYLYDIDVRIYDNTTRVSSLSNMDISFEVTVR